jgi:hypothetical protein
MELRRVRLLKYLPAVQLLLFQQLGLQKAFMEHGKQVMEIQVLLQMRLEQHYLQSSMEAQLISMAGISE